MRVKLLKNEFAQELLAILKRQDIGPWNIAIEIFQETLKYGDLPWFVLI